MFQRALWVFLGLLQFETTDPAKLVSYSPPPLQVSPGTVPCRLCPHTLPLLAPW